MKWEISSDIKSSASRVVTRFSAFGVHCLHGCSTSYVLNPKADVQYSFPDAASCLSSGSVLVKKSRSEEESLFCFIYSLIKNRGGEFLHRRAYTGAMMLVACNLPCRALA